MKSAAATVSREAYGRQKVDGKSLERIVLSAAGGGVRCEITNFGATLLSVKTNDKDGNAEEITLNHSTPADVIDQTKNMFFGKTAGRVANRIAKGAFTLDGRRYKLAVNNGPNHLHGGTDGFWCKARWLHPPRLNSALRFRLESQALGNHPYSA